MRVWRRIELDRVGPGRWLLRWERFSNLTGTTQELRVEGPPWMVLRASVMVLRATNRNWR